MALTKSASRPLKKREPRIGVKGMAQVNKRPAPIKRGKRSALTP